MTVAAGPTPAMVSESVTSKSPRVFVSSPSVKLCAYVPAFSRIVSAPGLVLARLIASRSDSLPSAGSTMSANVVTVKVAGTSRPSSGSTWRRFGRPVATCDFVGRLDQDRGDMIQLFAAMIAVNTGIAWAAGYSDGTGWRTPPRGRPAGCDGKGSFL